MWDETQPYVLFVGLNPSTADATNNDPTITRCINFAKSWGYGGMYVTNLFAYRATQPKDLKAAKNPVGKDNDSWVLKLAKDAGIIVAIWGNHGAYQSRSQEMLKILPRPHCLKVSKTGEPMHPLYLKADLKPSLLKRS